MTLTTPGLCSLAREVLALSLSGKDLACAAKMLACKTGESCKSFELFARSIWDLQERGFDLEEAIQKIVSKKNPCKVLLYRLDMGRYTEAILCTMLQMQGYGAPFVEEEWEDNYELICKNSPKAALVAYILLLLFWHN